MAKLFLLLGSQWGLILLCVVFTSFFRPLLTLSTHFTSLLIHLEASCPSRVVIQGHKPDSMMTSNDRGEPSFPSSPSHFTQIILFSCALDLCQCELHVHFDGSSRVAFLCRAWWQWWGNGGYIVRLRDKISLFVRSEYYWMVSHNF